MWRCFRGRSSNSAARYSVLGSRYSVLGARFSLLGSRGSESELGFTRGLVSILDSFDKIVQHTSQMHGLIQ